MKLKKLRLIPEVAQLYSHLESDFEKEIYTAALRNYCSMGNPIRFNNFAFVMRELLTKVVDRLAPTEDVKRAKWYSKESEDYEVTRKQQLKFCAQGYFVDSVLPDWVEKEVDEFIKEYLKLYRKLNQFTHISEKYKGLSPKKAFSFLKDLVITFSAILSTLSDVKSDITKEIESEIHDIVFNKLMFESHEALIELSSQTIVEGINIEGYWLSRVEPDCIIFEGEGYVECELNYGSKHDGVSMSHDVPFSFSLISNIEKVAELNFYEQGMYLDNSIFYE
ncbi:hypothetical protein [Alteromonas lipolytica]|uniref:Uncharacterized protein n=1 Tax=Alteromonas lipolytica TaxID=1856405 RepID=A0A1E8FGC8_9ALTE|nr:hypothetical protein [Alteromonas lipolytica]OFI34796.1 hypothetical protein BFC17_14560 [Alteromonas lipolytica]GGF54065.1 hypothetical protein GCM10011338_02790 [Alteromonas lipolytica]